MRRSLLVYVLCAAVAAIGMVIPASARSAMLVKATTTTTVATDVTSSDYDSWVTITAKVSSPGATPTGSVTLTDISNGSVLATPALKNGTATFRTAALAPGNRKIQAHYNGSTAFAASTSAGISFLVSSFSSVANAYQINPAHEGFQKSGAPNAESVLFFDRWHVTFGQDTEVSYPLIAGGRVFVTINQPLSSGGCCTSVQALDAKTGSADWGAQVSGTMASSTLAYDGQRVFVLNRDGTLTAYAAATGSVIWSKRLTGQISFMAPPTAYNTNVYVSGAGNGGTLYAVSEASGAVRWTASVKNGDGSSPAVDNSGVFLSFACHQDYRFSFHGTVMWHKDPGCQGLRGSTPALHGSRVYMRGDGDYPLIYDKASGTQLSSFVSDAPPAFFSDMYLLQGGKVADASQTGGGTLGRWTFGDGTLVLPAVVGGSYVYAVSRGGDVYAIDSSTGNQVWTVNVGVRVNGGPTAGMALGNNLLVVPAGSTLSAFGDSSLTSPGTRHPALAGQPTH
jgi:outer membrane protein assembly factor BamB